MSFSTLLVDSKSTTPRNRIYLG